MTHYLLDSHVLLWALDDEYAQKLPESVRKAITSPQSVIYYSILALWELTLKETATRHSAKPFTLPENFFEVLDSKDFICLPLARSHIQQCATLPFHHRDPFDRMLIAQAQTDDITIISADREFPNYEVKLLPWH